MKKQIIDKGLSGFFIGIAIGFIITIIISCFVNDGHYYPVTLELMNSMKNELNALILQTILCGIMGSSFAIASLIWEIESWSIFKQTAIYFSISCLIMFPIAYITNWMKHDIVGILSYISIFIIIFIIVWLIQYIILHKKIKQMNKHLKNRCE